MSVALQQRLWHRGPMFNLELACIDACHPYHLIRRLLIFECNSDAQRDAQVNAIKAAMEPFVCRCPLMAGLVIWPPADAAAKLSDRWRTIIDSPGLQLVVRDLRKDLPSLEELAASGYQSSLLPHQKLIPMLEDNSDRSTYSVGKVQYSAIEGGAIVSFAMSHHGVAMDEMLRIFSDEVRRNQSPDQGGHSAADHSIGLDRSAVRDLTGSGHFSIDDHPGYSLKGSEQDAEPQRHPFEAVEAEVCVIKTISADKLAQLKIDATVPGASWILSHDAIAALVWCTITRLRYDRSSDSLSLPDSTPCSLFMPSNARHHLGLSPIYVGNAVYQIAATLALSILLSSDGLKHAAREIRRALSAATQERVRDLIAESNKGWIDWAFPHTMKSTGVAMGTDWTSGTIYEYDWGPAYGAMRECGILWALSIACFRSCRMGRWK